MESDFSCVERGLPAEGGEEEEGGSPVCAISPKDDNRSAASTNRVRIAAQYSKGALS